MDMQTIPPEDRAELQLAARMMHKFLNPLEDPHKGFVLLVFDNRDPRPVSVASNASGDVVMALLRRIGEEIANLRMIDMGDSQGGHNA